MVRGDEMQGSRRSNKAACGLAAGLMLALTLGVSVAALAQDAPDKIVKNVADDVLTALRQDPDLQAGSQTKMAHLIEQKVAPHFDFERMTRLAVGRSWRQATADQQKALVEQFRALLVRSYSTAYTAYRNIVIEVKPLKMQSGDDDVLVRSEIKLPGGAPPVGVDYSMFKTDSDWKVYDVTVEGVSLVTTYRNTFAEDIRQNGIDGLIKSLQEKNAPPPPGVKKKQ
jgi:phospholipid transport system substrate-binding protein